MFRHAVDALQLVRDLDPTRLVLLGSGRWDGERAIGSVADPGQRAWQPLWGEEGPDEASSEQHVRGYVEGVGDRHFYPPVPQDAEADARLRTMGTKPVFLSEYGIGSLFTRSPSCARWSRPAPRSGRRHRADVADARGLPGRMERFGLDAVYAFPEDLLRDSYRWHSEHRARGLDLIWANPNVNGHNITGMLDHAVTGEGLWTFDRRWKPGVVEAVSEGLAPVRWCVFVTRGTATAATRCGSRWCSRTTQPAARGIRGDRPGPRRPRLAPVGAVPRRADGPYASPSRRGRPLDAVGELGVAVSVRGQAAPPAAG